MRFSQRIGQTPVRSELQIDDMDPPLRSRLWNLIYMLALNKREGELAGSDKNRSFYQSLYHNFFKQPVDELPDYGFQCVRAIREWYGQCEWFAVYDFVEYLMEVIPEDQRSTKLLGGLFNEVLEEEMSGFRVVGRQVTPITDPTEIAALEEAAAQRGGPFAPARQHIEKAIGHCFNRKEPDYANAIKEAISAVESAVVILTEGKAKTLGAGLKVLSDASEIHPALKEAFSKLYGYTSDQGGIRHAMIGDSKVGFAEAKYMVISCSAFLNYIVERHGKSRG